MLLLVDIYRRIDRELLEQKLYMGMLCSNIILIFLDMVAWGLDGRASSLLTVINLAGYVLYFALSPVPCFLWLLYTENKIYNDEKRIRRIAWSFCLPAIFMAVLACTTPFTGYLFYLDGSHVYHRGPGFLWMVVITYGYLAFAALLVIGKRRQLAKEHFLTLLLFPLPPFLGSILQVCFYGVSLVWTGMALSLLMVFLNIQNRTLRTDYLTGVYNRLYSDRCLREKIRCSTPEQTFAGILMDLDDFKRINDEYGHDQGDEALAITAGLIGRSIRPEDFLARYGGDEFIAFINIRSAGVLEKTVNRIRWAFEGFNARTDKPYKLNLSMGYDLYEPDSGMSADEFVRHIDELMYKDKKKNKRL